MRKSYIFFLWCIVCICTSVKGSNSDIPRDPLKDSVVFKGVKAVPIQADSVFSDSLKGHPKDANFHKKHRLVAALLAFPLGVLGLHRIYMHTSPIVPMVYIATFGGLFGVLPFIDFVLILLNKDIHLTYTSNPHLFMWQKR
jgi:TM2 domain-containing membrane protein YozV